jgi:hypothetical protein
MRRIRKALSIASIAALAVAFAPALPASGQTTPENDADTTVVVSGGGQLVSGVEDERGEAKFEEYRDVPEGFVLDLAHVRYQPADGKVDFDFTAIDAGQDDQRYGLGLRIPGTFSLRLGYTQLPRTYSTGSTTLYSGIGTGFLTIPESFRQGAEDAAGAPNAPYPPAGLKSYMDAGLANGTTFTLGTERKDFGAAFDYTFLPGLTLSVTGRNDEKDGTRAMGFGTYIRRQALAGIPGTGANQFWRETFEPRGSELIEPIDWTTQEFGATLVWAKNGNSATAGAFVSEFENDITALYFDNPFEASPGRASATIFDPKSEQEPGAPNGNNNLRGLYARSSMQLVPNNDYERIFGTVSLKLPASTRLNITVAQGSMEQNDPFMPYAENTAVVYSGTAGQPGVVYAHDAPLPRASLDGKMETFQADLRVNSQITSAVDLRGEYRYYELDDQRPSILFPGFSSSGDSYFRPGIGQKDPAGNRILYNEIGGYSRERILVGGGWKIGGVRLDGEVSQTTMDYHHRQVEETTDDAFRVSVLVPVGQGTFNVYYYNASRDFDGDYHMGLETSGVRSFDVWTRDRDEIGGNFEMPVGESMSIGFGGTFWEEEYPGAVEGKTYGWGLQDTSSSSVFAMASYDVKEMTFSGSIGYDTYDFNSLQVTKSSLTTDYNPTNRWTRESSDEVYWIGLEALVPFGADFEWLTAVDYQRFTGTWETTNLGTPDINSAVAYEYPEFSDDTVSLRTSLLWQYTERLAFELRYWYEPYNVDDFTIDVMQPYMQGIFEETHSSPTDVGAMNVGRHLFLDNRYDDYDASVLSALVRYSF